MPRAKPLLEPDQFARYSRHLRLPEIGVEGQRRLLEARVLLIGAGGLGCPLAQYLAAAGVGAIGLIDFDRVDASNLQRQVLYGTADVGRPKIEVARERIAALNPDVTVEAHEVLLSSDNALEILGGYDVVVDGTDNFPTRYLSNDACVLLGKPNVHGSIFRFEGQATVFDASRGPCYRCLYPEPPPPGAVPSCAEGGVLGVLPGLIAMIQATETVKLVTGIGEPLIGRLIQYDALQMEFAEFRLRKDPKCPVCGEQPTVTELIDYEGFCGVGVGAESGVRVTEVTAAETRARRERGEELLLLDVREPWEVATARLEGSVSIPSDEIESRLEELAEWRQRPIVVHCHHGGRSARVCGMLQEKGFERVENMAGGIEAWSVTVDPDVPRYSELLKWLAAPTDTRGGAMAKSRIPGPLERRHLVERELSPAQALRIAEAYLAAERSVEAVDFLRKAGADERLEALWTEALESGDAFLLRAVATATGREPRREEWRALAEAATAAGKERYAVEAKRQAERGED